MSCQCKAEEYHCAWMSILWGLWLLLPFHTFDLPSYALFDKLAPEWLWGVIFVSWGLAHFLVIKNGVYGARRNFSILGVFKWTALAILYIASNQTGLGAAFCSSFAVVSGFNFIALRVREGNGNGLAAETKA